MSSKSKKEHFWGRQSKSRALKALESYYSNGEAGGATAYQQQHLLVDGEHEIYENLNSLFDISNGFSIDHHSNKQPSVATRLSISNVKKKFIVEQYQKDIFVPTEIIMSKGKGNGVKVLDDVESGVLVVEYKGELIGKQEAERRERLYARNSTTLRMDCYLFFFEHKGKVMCVDPTIPSVDLGHGRYINHKVDGNLDPIKIQVNGVPKIVLISNRAIKRGEELFFDYGDRSSVSLTYFPWLRNDYKPLSDDEDEDIHDEQVVATTKITSSSSTTSDSNNKINKPPLKLILKRKDPYTTIIVASSISPQTTNHNNNDISSSSNSSNNENKEIITEKKQPININNNSSNNNINVNSIFENEVILEPSLISHGYDSESPGEMSDLDLGSNGYDETKYDINSEKWRTNIYELNIPVGIVEGADGDISSGENNISNSTATTTTTSTITTTFHNIKRIKLKYKEKQDGLSHTPQ
ncbi:hypothetical protein PPL_07386 [Heterostelium album PN500]|uniref:SET domain-containing protein n=1 Tax=Heterostelium pallidum (strain ATCC 26659 / Pp 5 / PN500) TaxID=670386 RepID=D3BFT5_HETP5|nr:hypothetical protein PPL_07386 [Heterostelium album PN500]EFA79695.1 hypothetical protein PPL_07386 [Heterostelium album PN500]|eukprot:XP_020431816.1 hypothetical protein PPL_07386 [Heterostelium album PN500]